MNSLLLFAYIILSYIAIDRVWYSKRSYIIRNHGAFYTKKISLAILFGFIFIPIFIVQMIVTKK